MAMNIKHRFYHLLSIVSMVVLAGSIGDYFLLGGQATFLDCLYMTVVSLTTVGCGEIVQVTGNVPAEIFTMVLITFGMGVILYGITTLTALIIEGELTGMLRKKKMEKRIAKLEGHYIVCGGGETGRPTPSPLAGCEIRHSGLKDKYNLLVLGARRPDEDIRFNPPATEILSAGAPLIIMGDMGDIVRARSCF